MKTNITKMTTGQTATIEKLLFKQVPLPLLEMGFLEGAEIILQKKALFGCPMYLKVDGFKVVIRKKDAKNIIVSKN